MERNLAYAKMARYFKLYDLEAYPAAIRKLAGLSEITEGDRAEVEGRGHIVRNVNFTSFLVVLQVVVGRIHQETLHF